MFTIWTLLHKIILRKETYLHLKKTDYPFNPVFSIFEIWYSGNLCLISQKTISINLKISQYTVNSNSTAWKNYMADKISKVLIITTVIHYNDVIMSAITSQITSLTIVYSTVYSDADQRKHQSSASLAFVAGIHRWLVNSPRTKGQ